MLIRNLSHLPLLALLLNVSTLSAQTLFWADLAGRIQKSGTDGAPITTILRSEAPEDLLTSPDGQTLYWSESGNNGIWKYAAGTPAPVKIYQAPETVRGLALDQDNLYFVQPAGIYRMKTDGSLPVVALAVSGANDICLIGGLLYWTGLQDGKIYKQNGLTGTAIFSSLSFPTNLLYNATDDRLYWLEYCGASTCSGIRKGKTDGTGKQIVVDEFISGFALDSAGATLYCTYDIYDEVFTISTTGTGRTSVA
ncbi:MAG: hypothetical protein JNK89_07765, partial [Saprospiraceae bacterium]|nr:hypothetical protein [Saprospiraceae bacterium]